MAKILVVDDLEPNRLLIVSLIHSQGHQSLEAADGAEALALMHQERPDLVISDILMPTMDGYEFVRRLRLDPALQATQVIYYTAHYHEREARNLAKDCGVAYVLIKPCSPELILRTVAQALAHVPQAEARPVVADFSDKHLRLITDTLSAKVAELETVNRRLAALQELNLLLASENSPSVLLEKVCRGARELMGAQYAVVCANGKSPEELVFATSGIDTNLLDRLEHPALDSGLLGETMRSRRSRRVTTTDCNPARCGLPKDSPALRSALMAPIESLSRAYGWLCLVNKLGDAEFSLDDEQLLTVLAAQSGRIYENGSLYLSVQRQAEALQLETAQRKRAAHELRTSEAGLRRAQSMAKLTHVITGPDGSFESWPPTMPLMLGLQPDKMVRSTREWLELVHPEDKAQFRRTAVNASQFDKRMDCEYRLRRADGQWLHIRQVMEPIHDVDATGGGRGRWFNTLQDISAQKRVQDALRESDRRFSELLDNVELLSLMLDCQGRITYCNDYLLRLTDWRRQEVLGVSWFEHFIPTDLDRVKARFEALISETAEPGHFENEIMTRAGNRRLIRWTTTVLRSATGGVTGIASIGDDITDRRDAERKIRRLNRVYAVLSGINTLIVRVHNRDELFREACRIAVEQGQFKMARIGMVDPQGLRIQHSAASGADAQYLELIKDSFALHEDLPVDNRMTVRAVREKQALITNDVRVEPKPKFADALVARGILSAAYLPLMVSDNAVGVLALYSGEPGFFDDEEVTLLNELADDIGFALDHLNKEERLDYLAYYDETTGLPNRTLFLEHIGQLLRAREAGKSTTALVLIDIERFRNVNDTLDRRAGDDLLKLTAQRMQLSKVGFETVARVGINCYGVALQDARDAGGIALSVEQLLRDCFTKPFTLRGSSLRIAAKAGIALYPEDGDNAEALFRNAEVALKRAKGSAESLLFYTPEMNTRVAQALNMESRLRTALDLDQFVLHYQPKVDLVNGVLTGIEALIRWNDPESGLVPPAQFIPILEETGLIYEVGRWALHRAVQDYLRWYEAGLAPVRVAVNVSPLQLRHRGFVDEVRRALGDNPLAAAGLELEITESLIMENVDHNIASLHALRTMGVTIAIDDFGTGFSSLGYLAKLPVDTLKIDRSFVVDMATGAQGQALVGTIISLAHALKLKVVAEGVETEEQADQLRRLGCDEMQGFLFSKPIPKDLLETLHLSAVPSTRPGSISA